MPALPENTTIKIDGKLFMRRQLPFALARATIDKAQEFDCPMTLEHVNVLIQISLCNDLCHALSRQQLHSELSVPRFHPGSFVPSQLALPIRSMN